MKRKRFRVIIRPHNTIVYSLSAVDVDVAIKKAVRLFKSTQPNPKNVEVTEG